MAGTGLVRGISVAVLALLAVAVAGALLRRRTAVETGPLLSHVEELRRRLLVVAGTALAGILVALTLRFEWMEVPSLPGEWPVPVPALYDTLSAQLFSAMAAHLVPEGVQLVVTSPMDAFQAQFDVALAVGLFLAVPVALVQAGRFVAPALKPQERRFLRLAILPATALFAAGAAFGYAVVLPITLRALYRFSGPLGAADLLHVGELASFVLGFVLAFGVAFQTPLVMVVLSRIGLVDPATYWRGWRYAVLLVVIAAGILTHDPTVVSQAMLAIPLIALYVLGAALAGRVQRPAP